MVWSTGKECRSYPGLVDWRSEWVEFYEVEHAERRSCLGKYHETARLISEVYSFFFYKLEGKWQRETSHLLAHSASAPNSHGWAGCPRNSRQVLDGWQEPKDFSHHLLLPTEHTCRKMGQKKKWDSMPGTPVCQVHISSNDLAQCPRMLTPARQFWGAARGWEPLIGSKINACRWMISSASSAG